MSLSSILSALPLPELAALTAATMWAITGIITQPIVHHFGATATNRYRITIAGVILCLIASALGLWESINISGLGVLMLSGLVGIVVGDTALMQALKRIGPRRNSMVFATNAPIAAGLSYLWLGETLTSHVLIGCGLVFLGVVIAIWWGHKDNANTQKSMEKVTGSLMLGVCIGLIAALCQAVGAIITKPVLLTGADPIAASAIRVGFAGVCMWVMHAMPMSFMQWTKAHSPMTWQWGWRSFVSSSLGLVVGMTLLVYALEEGSVGLVTTLSATSPILILPILWLFTGQLPNRYAWLGSFALVVGCGFIFY